MLGELNTEMIEQLLKIQLFGRIGCHADGITYVVPVNYIYEAPYIYAHSGEGLKINLMRKNPEVCSEVDEVENLFNWRSVICWGIFEGITDMQEMQEVMQKIIASIEPYLSKTEDAHPSHGIADKASDIGLEKELVLYKINLSKKTRRFENKEPSLRFTQES